MMIIIIIAIIIIIIIARACFFNRCLQLYYDKKTFFVVLQLGKRSMIDAMSRIFQLRQIGNVLHKTQGVKKGFAISEFRTVFKKLNRITNFIKIFQANQLFLMTKYSWNPPPSLKGVGGGGGRPFRKLSHYGGGIRIFLLERGDKPEKVGG